MAAHFTNSAAHHSDKSAQPPSLALHNIQYSEENAPSQRSKLDWAIILSALAMAAISFYAIKSQLPSQAYASSNHACGASLA